MIPTQVVGLSPLRGSRLLLSLPEVKVSASWDSPMRMGAAVAALLVPRAGVLARDALEIARSIDDFSPRRSASARLWVEAIPAASPMGSRMLPRLKGFWRLG